MSETKDFNPSDYYQIRVAGRLERYWSEWLQGMSITHEGERVTILSGEIIDQPALHGLLNKIRDLGLILLSVTQLEHDE